jgi:uncharacterized protein
MTQFAPITEDDIADFLAHTPGFFERHADLLASIQLTSPHGQRAISLQERQAEMLREKVRGLELKAADMIRHGQENMHIADSLHRWTLGLLGTRDAIDLPGVVIDQLRQQFQVPQAAISLWATGTASDEVRAFAASLTTPYCGDNPGLEAVQWLEHPEEAKSIALIPLRSVGAQAASGLPAPGSTFGLLVLGSPDAQRFQSSMGTDFLERLGQLASAALERLNPA